jgi:Na+/H+-dicarboxylate symporter
MYPATVARFAADASDVRPEPVAPISAKLSPVCAVLVAAVLTACFVQYVLYGVLIAVFGRISPFPFFRKLVTTQIMAFSTSSSKATLTTAMRETENKLGVSAQICQFMLPLGAAVNMSGTAIYLAICALFFAQFFGVELHHADYAMLLVTCTLGSIGAAGIPSGSIIFMGMVLHSVGLPIEGIGLILGVDRILDMVRTMINITGDCAITLIIDSSEKTLNKDVYYS